MKADVPGVLIMREDRCVAEASTPEELDKLLRCHGVADRISARYIAPALTAKQRPCMVTLAASAYEPRALLERGGTAALRESDYPVTILGVHRRASTS